MIRHGVEQNLKGSVASKNQNALPARLCGVTRFCSKILRILSRANFDFPAALTGEFPQIGKELRGATTSRSGVYEKEV